MEEIERLAFVSPPRLPNDQSKETFKVGGWQWQWADQDFKIMHGERKGIWTAGEIQGKGFSK